MPNKHPKRPPDPRRIEALGDIAEHHFKGWCLASGLRPTPPGKDRMGWDFFVEFPQEQRYTWTTSLPL